MFKLGLYYTVSDGEHASMAALPIFYFIVHPSKCHAIVILCDVGEGLYWHRTRTVTSTAASRVLS